MTPRALAVPSITLPAACESARIARGFIREHSVLDSMRHMEADLLVTELVANLIEHCPTASKFELSVDNRNRRGVKITLAHSSPTPLETTKRGIGFTLMDRLARSWGHDYQDDRLSIWFVVRKPGSAALEEDLSDEELAQGMQVDPVSHSDALVRRHRDLAAAIARRYRGKGIAEEDLNQVAMMALLKAIQRYDPEVGDLRPFAAATISGELKRLLRDKGWSVRVPRPVQERALAIGKTDDELTQKLGREPTIAETAQHLGLTEEEVIEGMWARLLYASRSIDRESNKTGLTILEHLPAERSEIDPEDRLLLEQAQANLSERKSLIVSLRFVEDKTQDEIAEIVGVSQMHVSRLLASALSEMRRFLLEAVDSAAFDA